MDLRTLRIRAVGLVILAGSAAGNVHDTDALAAAPAARAVVLTGSSGPAGSVGGIALNLAASSSSWLYGVSTVDGKVFIVDTATRQEVYSFGIEKGILTPDDLVIASNGDIYYTDTLAGFAGRIVLGPNPPASTVMVPVTNPVTSFIPLPNSIALSADERHLYVGSCFAPPPFPNLIYDIDLVTGTVSPVRGPAGNPVSLPSCSLNGMRYRNGFLYGAQTVTGDILRVGPVDVPLQAQVAPVVAGQLTLPLCGGSTRDIVNPSSVAFDSAGQLFVIDAFTSELRVVANPDGLCQPSTVVATLPGPGAVASIAIDRNRGDRAYVSSAADGYILNVSDDVFVKTPGLVLPLGLAAARGRLYLGDYSTLRTVDLRGDAVTESVTQTIQGFLDGLGVAAPFTIAPFGRELVLSDWLDQIIQVYDPDNDVAVATINTRPLTTGTPPAPLGAPLNAIEYRTISSERTIVAAHFVSAGTTSRLVRYSGPGFTTIHVLGSYPNRRFTGMASRGSRYWVADAVGGSIFEFDDNGIGAEVATGLVNPRGLDAWNGHLLVIEGAPAARLTAVRLADGRKIVMDTLPQLQPANQAVASSLVPDVTVDEDTQDVYFSAPGHVSTGHSDNRTLRRISAREIERLLRE